MGKILIYTAIFGEGEHVLHEPLQEIPDAELICITDRKDLKSDTWNIVHEKEIPGFFTFMDPEESSGYCYKHPRIKARIVKTVLPVRIRTYSITDFFNKHEDQIYIWMDASMQLKQSPQSLIDEIMKDADIMSFQHPDRQNLEEEAAAAAKWRGTNLEKALIQVASCRARGFTSAEQKTLTATGFFCRKHTVQMDFFNLSWIKEILLYTERDQLSVDYCIWKHKLKIQYIPSVRSYRRNPWVQFFPHKIETPNSQ